jgi:hypothetical protein
LLAAAKIIDGLLDRAYNELKFILLSLKGPDITSMYVTDLIPLLFAEVGRLRILAIRAPHFDDTAALGRLRSIVALLGDIATSPEPERAMYLYIMSV